MICGRLIRWSGPQGTFCSRRALGTAWGSGQGAQNAGFGANMAVTVAVLCRVLAGEREVISRFNLAGLYVRGGILTGQITLNLLTTGQAPGQGCKYVGSGPRASLTAVRGGSWANLVARRKDLKYNKKNWNLPVRLVGILGHEGSCRSLCKKIVCVSRPFSETTQYQFY